MEKLPNYLLNSMMKNTIINFVFIFLWGCEANILQNHLNILDSQLNNLMN